ncbi:hypothetical protein AAVH_10660 [Aphelenchoides avenae]|nr:hypothetical protein AAVH_10660 [Aphelenchus avenae]
MSSEPKSMFYDSHCHIDLLQAQKVTVDLWVNNLTDEERCEFGGCIPNFCYPKVYMDLVGAKRTMPLNGSGGGHDEELENMDLPMLARSRGLMPSNWILGVTFGCHPKNSDQYSDDVEKTLRSFFDTANVEGLVPIAVGECGLDESNEKVPDRATQLEVFGKQLEIAAHYDLPVVIHIRGSSSSDASLEYVAMELMQKKLRSDHHVHRHCYGHGIEVANEWISRFPNTYFGLVLSITGKCSGRVKQFVREFDLTRIVTETDSPYFGLNGAVGNPGNALAVARKLATVRKVPLEDVLAQIEKNIWRLYKLPSKSVDEAQNRSNDRHA